MKGTIYYIIPDIFNRKINFRQLLISVKRGNMLGYLKSRWNNVHKPVGGIKIFYQHCLMLRELGYSVYPLTMGDYVGNFFGYDLQIKAIRDIGYTLKNDDIVVCCELHPYDGLKFKNAKKILFMQNWINLDNRLKKQDHGKSYIDIGYDYVITCGDYCTEMVRKKMGIDATTITNGIDQSQFFPDPSRRIENRVLVMSRRNVGDFNKIKELLANHAIDFKVVDGLTQSQIIAEYQQADIFLAIGYPEGLPLPPMEAMNCGCAVVGFTGGGGREYMIDGETALVANDGDCAAAAAKLLELINDKALKEKIRANGTQKAQTYTLAACKQKVADFYKGLS
jgi:Glycosyl transferases group 1